MAERLVVQKSRRQRRIEAVLLIVLPPLLGGWLWYRGGGTPLNALVVVTVFFLVTPMGGLIASFGSGERITPDERMRRALERAARMPFAVLAGWTWITYTSVFLSALLAAATPAFAKTLLGFTPAFAGVTLACALLVTFQLRRWYRHYDPARPAERYQSVGQWLKEFLPVEIVCVGAGLVAGFVVAHFVPNPYVGVTLGGGWLLGIGFEAVVADRVLRRKPLLWSQVGFRGALTIAMARMGLMFAAFSMLFGLLQPIGLSDLPYEWLVTTVFVIVAGLVGFVFGTLLMLVMWALARLGDARARKINRD